MTTIVAVKDKDGVVIGSDTAATAHNFQFKMVSETGKWIISESGDWAVGFSGSLRLANIIEMEKERIFHKLDGHFDFANRLEDVMKNYDVTLKDRDEDGEERLNNIGLSLILCNSEQIFLIEHNFVALEVKGFASQGSGSPFAHGAYRALVGVEEAEFPAEEVALRTLKVAESCDIYTNEAFFIGKLASREH